MSHLLPTYARQPIAFVKGEGTYLFSASGTAYFDALSGIAVCGLGHSHPAVTQALSDQAGTLIHTSNLFEIPWQEQAGTLLCTKAGMDKVFFANSGAEANECALKLARLYAHTQNKARPKVIVMEHAFHGRTLLSVSATANPKAREGFFVLDTDFIRVPFDDVAAVEAHTCDPDVCAVLVEPIQGEGGLHTPSPGYLEALSKICDDNGWLFMLDEVQTGNGRTGKYFAYQHSAVRPDVLTTAKGLGNGVPVGACMVAGRARDLFGAGAHGSTFGGSPLICRVVCTVYEHLDDALLKNVIHQSARIRQAISDNFPSLELRGQGMMIGIVLPEHVDCSKVVDIAREHHHLILNVTGGHVIRLLPPLNLSDSDNTILCERLLALIAEIL